jgi:hypothetical protein
MSIVRRKRQLRRRSSGLVADPPVHLLADNGDRLTNDNSDPLVLEAA